MAVGINKKTASAVFLFLFFHPFHLSRHPDDDRGSLCHPANKKFPSVGGVPAGRGGQRVRFLLLLSLVIASAAWQSGNSFAKPGFRCQAPE